MHYDRKGIFPNSEQNFRSSSLGCTGYKQFINTAVICYHSKKQNGKIAATQTNRTCILATKTSTCVQSALSKKSLRDRKVNHVENYGFRLNFYLLVRLLATVDDGFQLEIFSDSAGFELVPRCCSRFKTACVF